MFLVIGCARNRLNLAWTSASVAQMSRSRPFAQVDVFATTPYAGNPVAVVLDGEGLSTAELQRIARWTNLSETTFLLPPTDPAADYAVRIFTPASELPFAGHPTLGSCHAWLEAGGRPRAGETIVQECGAGLVPVRRTADGLGFQAPPLLRSGPLEPALLDEVVSLLGIARDDVVDAAWADNGPGWVAVLLKDAETVLGLRPSGGGLDVGVAAPQPPGSETAFEVRAFFPVGDQILEDPVTGSLNASLAQWLLATGRASAPYVAAQGTAIGREGRVHVSQDEDGGIWVAGGTRTLVRGTLEL